ncbi:hypothetical protein FTX61_20705 [Nitriliruptoraceae bacterium ZYF776]|nr:hypothetical protein [Profundirhabdus halotolerans]
MLGLLVALLVPLLPVVASPTVPTAEASTINPPPRFDPSGEDGRLVLADEPSAISFLGLGRSGLQYVTETKQATLANTFGFDADLIDGGSLATAEPYPASTEHDLGTEVLDQAVVVHRQGTLPGPDGTVEREVLSASITRSGPDAPWTAHLLGPQSGGFADEVTRWSFGASEASDTAVPGEPVGVISTWSTAGLPQLVFATDAGLFAYAVARDDVRLVGSTLVGGGILQAPPIAVHTDLRNDLPGIKPYDNEGYFAVATVEDLAEGVSRMRDLHLVRTTILSQTTQSTTFHPVAVTGSSSLDITWPTDGQPLQLRLSRVPDLAEIGDSHAFGVQADGRFVRFWRNRDSSSIAVSGDPQTCGFTGADGAATRTGFDFREIRFVHDQVMDLPTNASGPQTLWVAMCATPDAGQGGYEGMTLHTMYRLPGFPEPELAQRFVRRSTQHYLVDPQVELTFACPEALRAEGVTSLTALAATQSCAGGILRDDEIQTQTWFRFVGATVLAGVSTDRSARRSDTAQVAMLGMAPFASDPERSVTVGGSVAPPYLQWLLTRWNDTSGFRPMNYFTWRQAWTRIFSAAEDPPRHLTRLPGHDVVLEVELLDDQGCIGTGSNCNPAIELGKPVPMAVLAAPPFVAGAGQEPASPPTFAQSTAIGGGTDALTATRIGASVGLEVEVASFGLETQVSYEREVETTTSTTLEVEQGQAFVGLPDQDVLVYNATSMWALPAEVHTSSTGLGVGTTVTLRHPRTNIMSASSVDHVRTQWPELYGEDALLGRGLDRTLSHQPGDPGSYPRYLDDDLGAGGAVDQACIGSLDGTEPIRDTTPTHITPNPFLTEPNPTPPMDAILLSPAFQVQAGTANSEGATVELSSGMSQSYLATHSVDASVKAKAFYMSVTGTGGFTTGSGWTYEVSENTAFEGYVGHIPFAGLQDETYEWRMYLCKQDLGGYQSLTERLPVWVLGYTVDNYAGSGGLALSELEAVSPIASQTVDRDTRLSWRLESGTISRFDWELEAVGAYDRRSGSVDYPSIAAFRDEHPPGEDIDVSVDLDRLLPGQTYRWRVAATDFFGNRTSSAYEYFVTAGPPDASFAWSPSDPVVGDEVTFSAVEPDADTTSFAWDLAGTAAAGGQTSTTFDAPGLHEVTLEVATPNGTSTSTRSVAVRASVQDGAFVATQGERLSVPAPGVLADDLGSDHAELVNQALHGEVRLASSGAFTYQPDPGYCGDDAFTYRGSGGGTAGTLGTVTIDVRCVPAGTDHHFDALQDEQLLVEAPGVLAEVDHAHLDAVRAELVDDGDHGTVVLDDDGSFTYQPEGGWCGDDRFTYRPLDPSTYDEVVAGPSATVTITVACASDDGDDDGGADDGDADDGGADDGEVDDGDGGDDGGSDGGDDGGADDGDDGGADDGDGGSDVGCDVPSFRDVTARNVHAGAIDTLARACVTAGYPDGTYRPGAPVTRGQLATFIANALDLEPTGTDYPDVPSHHPHARGIRSLGVIAGGFEDGRFRPDAAVTRGQLATLLRNAAQLPGGNARFPDVPRSNVHATAISAVAAAGIQGFEDGTFRPAQRVTRGQMATFLVRTLVE